jgi:hypothetical protein
MLVATLVNLLLLVVFFIIGFVLISLYLNANPESTLAPLLIGLVFLGSILLSFLVYSKLVKFVVNKFDLESKMDPLFGGSRKKKPRNPDLE